MYYLSLSRTSLSASLASAGILFLAFRPSRAPRSTITRITLIRPAPTIFYGRDDQVDVIVKQILIGQKPGPEHIAIRGGAGIGKTSVALAVMHDKRITKRFRDARHWVPCDQTSTIQQFLEEIASALSLDMAKTHNRLRDILFFLQQNPVPRIITLDNFETIWSPVETRAKSEDILVALSPYLIILLTTRGPYPAIGRLRWYELDPIEPLSLSAARQAFTSIRSKHIDDRLDDLLRAVDCVPLPVVLLASYGQRGFSTSKLLEIWNEKQTRLLDDGVDRLSNLDISLRISLDSPPMKARPDALMLLSMIAHLPGGIVYDNLQEIGVDVVVTPLIWDIHKAAKTLIDTALVQHTTGVLKVHSTIRSHMGHYHPLSPFLKPGLQVFYFQLAGKAGHEPGTKHFSEAAVRALSRERANAEAVILDALKYKPDAEAILAASHYSNYLIENMYDLEVPRRAVEAIRKFSSPEIDLLLPLCLLRLGTLYAKLDQYPQALDTLKEAEEGYKWLNQSEGVGKALYAIADVHRIRGDHSQATELIAQAYKEFEAIGSPRDISRCLRNLGIIYFANDSYQEAVQTMIDAQNACPSEDITCLNDCKRELGMVYRKENPAEAIRLLREARAYYLLHGFYISAAHCLYQQSIAHYRQKDYVLAERGLIEAYAEFKHLGDCGQMGYCVYHQGVLNAKRWFVFKALRLFEQSRAMFEHMENPLMDAFSLLNKARVSAALCRANDAQRFYRLALEKLEKLQRDTTVFKLEMQSISRLCMAITNPFTADWYVLIISIIIFCSILVSSLVLYIRRGRDPK